MSRQTRRTFLTAASAVLGSALAGCAGGGAGGPGGGDSDGLVAQSSFFVFGDLTAAVAGETATAETLVPVGQHGHGWEPGPDLQATVLESDLFVHGMEGFQPWADDVVDNIRADGADVETVTITRDVELLTPGGHEDEHHHEDDGSNHEDDDHAEYDPHFWLDPTRTATALATVRDAFLELDGENADSYRANAEDYRERLLTLHEDILALAEGADDATVLVAGHDAFGYLEARYGIEFEALTGVSPDASPTPRDIERAQQLIAEHDIEYVVADPLESQRAAEQLVEDTDASEVLPLTSLPGRTDEWASQGWGYVDVMREVNLPTLEKVLASQ
jgi:zinc transport system substrate-binding protein